MDNTTESKTTRHWLSEGLIIATIPVVGYLIAFLYEAGFAWTFNIPVQFISVNLTNIFIATIYVIGVIFLIFIILDLLLPRKDNIIYKNIISAIMLLVMWVIFFYPIAYHLSWIMWIGCVGVVLLLIMLERFVLPLITQRGIGNYKDKLKAHLQKWQESGSKSFLNLINANYLLIIVILVFTGFISHVVGRIKSVTQDEFIVISDNTLLSESVVLRIYGDTMICAPFDRGKKEVEQYFHIIKIAEDPKLTLNMESVGPLKSAPNDPGKIAMGKLIDRLFEILNSPGNETDKKIAIIRQKLYNKEIFSKDIQIDGWVPLTLSELNDKISIPSIHALFICANSNIRGCAAIALVELGAKNRVTKEVIDDIKPILKCKEPYSTRANTALNTLGVIDNK